MQTNMQLDLWQVLYKGKMKEQYEENGEETDWDVGERGRKERGCQKGPPEALTFHWDLKNEQDSSITYSRHREQHVECPEQKRTQLI